MAKGLSKIETVGSGPALTESGLSLLEARLNVTLPQEYRAFLLLHNGGAPKRSMFRFRDEAGPYTDSVVDQFLAVHDGDNHNLETECQFCKSENLLPEKLIPIAEDPGGNIICLSISGSDTNSVHFWDHEAFDENNKSVNLHLIANSFDEFIANLQEPPEYVVPEFDNLCLNNDVEGLKTLIASGWDVNSIHPGRRQTPIETSASHPKIEFIRVLLEHGAKIGRAREIMERCSAMPHMAELYDYQEALRLLTIYGSA